MYIKNKSFMLSGLLLVISSCGGGGGGGGSADEGGYGEVANRAPSITNTVFNVSVVEGETTAFTVTASDPDGDTLTYSLSGTDNSLFTITMEGVVTFNNAPDYENPADSGGNNVYDITSSVSDGTLSDSENFTVTVTNDISDDSDSAWNGELVKNDTYKPYDKHATSYGIIIGGLEDVTDGFMTNVANITNKILATNDATNASNRTTLIDNFSRDNFFQRVGSTGMSSYDPALNETNYPGWDNINDNYTVIDFIWEATSNSSSDERTKTAQINGILEHILHTITLGYDKSFIEVGSGTCQLSNYLAIGNNSNFFAFDPTKKSLSLGHNFAYQNNIKNS